MPRRALAIVVAIFGGLFVLAALLHGTQALLTAWSHPELRVYTAREYLDGLRLDRWVRLTDCQLDYSQALWWEETYGGRTRVTEVFVPVWPVDAPADAVSELFLATDDPYVVAIAEQLAGVPEDRIDAYCERNAATLYPVRSIEGVVRSGLDHDPETERMLRAELRGLPHDMVILDDGARPRLWLAALQLAAALGALLGGGWFVVSTLRTPDEVPQAAADGRPPAPVAVQQAFDLEPDPSPSIWRDGFDLVVPAGADLPARCFRCDDPATQPRQMNLSWHNPLYALWFLLSPLVYLIVYLHVRRRAAVRIHLCAKHRFRRVSARRIDEDGYVWLKGCGQAYLAGFPTSPREAAEPLKDDT